MRSAFITGITGQDGSYLAEHLLGMNYRVVGGTRKLGATGNSVPLGLLNHVELVEWDPLEQSSVTNLLLAHQPDEIYNFAGYSTGSGMYDDPVGIGEVNGLAVVRILEAMRTVAPSARFCQASSREIFGEARESPQSERTAPNPRSPYGAAKLYADTMIKIYRARYDLFAASAILFNHESPRRGTSFITRKITRAAARIKLGDESELKLGNLDSLRDWGFAGDYVEAMWLMLQQGRPDDYVIASGVSHSVRDVCQVAFERVGLNYLDYVREDSTLFRPSEPLPLVGDAAKAREHLHWSPKLGFEDMICQMVDHDFALLRQERQQARGAL